MTNPLPPSFSSGGGTLEIPSIGIFRSPSQTFLKQQVSRRDLCRLRRPGILRRTCSVSSDEGGSDSSGAGKKTTQILRRFRKRRFKVVFEMEKERVRMEVLSQYPIPPTNRKGTPLSKTIYQDIQMDNSRIKKLLAELPGLETEGLERERSSTPQIWREIDWNRQEQFWRLVKKDCVVSLGPKGGAKNEMEGKKLDVGINASSKTSTDIKCPGSWIPSTENTPEQNFTTAPLKATITDPELPTYQDSTSQEIQPLPKPSEFDIISKPIPIIPIQQAISETAEPSTKLIHLLQKSESEARRLKEAKLREKQLLSELESARNSQNGMGNEKKESGEKILDLSEVKNCVVKRHWDARAIEQIDDIALLASYAPHQLIDRSREFPFPRVAMEMGMMSGEFMLPEPRLVGLEEEVMVSPSRTEVELKEIKSSGSGDEGESQMDDSQAIEARPQLRHWYSTTESVIPVKKENVEATQALLLKRFKEEDPDDEYVPKKLGLGDNNEMPRSDFSKTLESRLKRDVAEVERVEGLAKSQDEKEVLSTGSCGVESSSGQDGDKNDTPPSVNTTGPQTPQNITPYDLFMGAAARLSLLHSGGRTPTPAEIHQIDLDREAITGKKSYLFSTTRKSKIPTPYHTPPIIADKIRYPSPNKSAPSPTKKTPECTTPTTRTKPTTAIELLRSAQERLRALDFSQTTPTATAAPEKENPSTSALMLSETAPPSQISISNFPPKEMTGMGFMSDDDGNHANDGKDGLMSDLLLPINSHQENVSVAHKNQRHLGISFSEATVEQQQVKNRSSNDSTYYNITEEQCEEPPSGFYKSLGRKLGNMKHYQLREASLDLRLLVMKNDEVVEGGGKGHEMVRASLDSVARSSVGKKDFRDNFRVLGGAKRKRLAEERMSLDLSRERKGSLEDPAATKSQPGKLPSASSPLSQSSHSAPPPQLQLPFSYSNSPEILPTVGGPEPTGTKGNQKRFESKVPVTTDFQRKLANAQRPKHSHVLGNHGDGNDSDNHDGDDDAGDEQSEKLPSESEWFANPRIGTAETMSLERPRSITLVHVNGSGTPSRKRSSSSGVIVQQNQSRRGSINPFPASEEDGDINTWNSTMNPVLPLAAALCITPPTTPQQPHDHSPRRSSRIVDTGTFDPIDIDNDTIPTPWVDSFPNQAQPGKRASRIPVSNRGAIVVQKPIAPKAEDITKHHKRVDSKGLIDPKGSADSNPSPLAKLNSAASSTANVISKSGASSGNILEILKLKRSRRRSDLVGGRRDSVAANSMADTLVTSTEEDANGLNTSQSVEQGDTRSLMTSMGDGKEGKREKMKKFFGRKKAKE